MTTVPAIKSCNALFLSLNSIVTISSKCHSKYDAARTNMLLSCHSRVLPDWFTGAKIVTVNDKTNIATGTQSLKKGLLKSEGILTDVINNFYI